MVVDLQGIISTDESGRKTLELTDPAIHCIDLTRFGKTNFGFEGMKTFFGRHLCYKYYIFQGISSTDESGRKTLELTDPAIHCIDLTRFGKTNFGFEGMKTFFGRHVCNRFCTAMEPKAPAL
ncbi:alpha-kinase family domain-containing protein [Ditylenchus destructor]|uniref:Alpha-kinase family domain-containing protein n=1 Tax=Ditylenchus destructor TaxID=166010 RepID=A0AAD4QW73_9BILA|nr:alpha-kinase family domain-containing protein [Ditylenchus destructor]